MSSEVQISCKPFNYHTRPKLNKCKALNSSHVDWSVPFSDFQSESRGKKQSSLQSNCGCVVSDQDKNAQNISNSVKRKSMSETIDFSNGSELNYATSILHPISPKTCLFFNKKERIELFPKKKCNFNVHEIQATFLKNQHKSKLCYPNQSVEELASHENLTGLNKNKPKGFKVNNIKATFLKNEKNSKLCYTNQPFVKSAASHEISAGLHEDKRSFNNSFLISQSFSLNSISKQSHSSSSSKEECLFPLSHSEKFSTIDSKKPNEKITWESTSTDQYKKKGVAPFKAIENFTFVKQKILLKKNIHQSTRLKKIPIHKNFIPVPSKFDSFQNSSFVHNEVPLEKVKKELIPCTKPLVDRKNATLTNEKHSLVSQLDFFGLESEFLQSSHPSCKRKIVVESGKEPEEVISLLDFQPKSSSSIENFKSKTNSETFGSNWVQSLQWENEESETFEKKKKLRNVLLDGYSDQFQKLVRREMSDFAICEHKKGKNEFLAMTIIAVLHVHDIVVAKCSLLDSFLLGVDDASKSQLKNILKDFCSYDFASYPETEIKQLIAKLEFLVLFQKNFFSKQLLKTGKSFLLLNPWHYLKLNSLQKPIILCKYFKNIAAYFPSSDNLQANNLAKMKRNAQNLQKEKTKLNISQNLISNSFKMEEKNLFWKWNKNIDLVARIQRIWKNKNSANNIFTDCETSLRVQLLNRFSLLLQSKEGIFFELIISCSEESTILKWLQCKKEREGKCYVFHNLRVVHKLEQKKYPKLFNYLSVMLEQSRAGRISSDFVYQLVLDDDTSKLPTELINADIPPYMPTYFQPLIQLQKDINIFHRFSCKVKVLFQYDTVVYVTDESLLAGTLTQYIKVFLSKADPIVINSEIIIKDALVHEGCLFMDRYSQLLIMPNSPKQNNCAVLNLTNIETPLKCDSKTSDLVSVEGNVISVDESNSYTWLECNICMKENLVQDSNNVIYCEDCSFKAVQPLLKAKMTVRTVSEVVPNAMMIIQLLSRTTKKMLEIDEKSLQPQCNVTDIIDKKIGPLLCYVKGQETEENEKLIYLSEIEQL